MTPSALGINAGFPAFVAAITELVVPRSIPVFPLWGDAIAVRWGDSGESVARGRPVRQGLDACHAQGCRRECSMTTQPEGLAPPPEPDRQQAVRHAAVALRSIGQPNSVIFLPLPCWR
jgi:hypothetical protein